MVMAKKKPRKPTSKSRKVSKGKPGAGTSGKYLGHYGWMPDVPDQRDLVLTAARVTTLPPSVDLRPGCPPVYDQGQLGSCTANAIAAAIQYEQIRQKEAKPFAPSRLFIYYNERVMEHTVSQDAGAQIRDGMKSINHIGACPETDWPYVIANFAQKPPLRAFKDAPLGKTISYQRVVQTLDQMRACLAGGSPIVLGISVYESFESREVAKSGAVPMPGNREKLLGGHAILAVGYHDADQRFIMRNSWGTSWGMHGYFTIPYAYLTDSNLCDDLWTIQTVA
jgi:C1A family cysteine protease